MRKQQQVWQQEHLSRQTLPSLADQKPSGNVVEFVKFLHKNGVTQGRTIDIGCGKGRNAGYLAQQGFKVDAIDYMQEALDAARQPDGSNRVTFIKSAMDMSDGLLTMRLLISQWTAFPRLTSKLCQVAKNAERKCGAHSSLAAML